MTTDPDRAERLAVQLRANLLRRKQQTRAAATTPPTEESVSGDQRAKAIDPSDVAAPAA